MKIATGQACGKIILSGEYAVVFGYPGIAVPAPFTVTATFNLTHHDTFTITHSGIENENYLHHILNEIQKYTGDLHGHLTIENHIPIGRGMGSSTALVIALCRCLLNKEHAQSPLSLKNLALSIENTVNPGNSGLDFAMIWEGKPVKFTKEDGPTTIDLDLSFLENAVLIDTGKPNETTLEMVAWIKGQIGIPSPSGGGVGRGGKKGNRRPPPPNPLPKGGGIAALQTIAHCTECLLTVSRETCHPEHSRGALHEIFPDHHRAQVALGVVPEAVQALIADIEKIGGAAKVIGAGGRSSKGTKILHRSYSGSSTSEARSAEPREGGGMVLALHPKPEELLLIAKQHGMPTVALTQIHPPLHSPSLTPTI